nr:hypothetical protein [Kiritimatiellia bacterium]
MNNQKYTLDTESPAAVVEARRVVKRIDAPEVEFPADKRPLGSRRVIPITREEPTCLYWDTYPNSEEPQSFRLVAGTDHRFAHRIRVGSAGTGDLYG